MSHVYSRRVRQTIGILQIAILVLVAVTAYVHLSRGIGTSAAPRFPAGARGPAGSRPPGGAPRGFNIIQFIPLPLSTLFLLNGISYLVLGAALYLPQLVRFQPVIRGLLIAQAAVTILMYLAIVGVRTNWAGWIDKIVEITLIVLLLLDGRRAATTATTVPRASTA